MASIFTYDHDPPRVSSPWTAGQAAIDDNERTATMSSDADLTKLGAAHRVSPRGQTASMACSNITRLSAEPEFGPTEYKLHLLLRPRRSFVATSTTSNIAGSQHSRTASTGSSPAGEFPGPPLSHSSASRQHRLEQLTTQLLWRLQQSSPVHASATSNFILPTLPEATAKLRPPQVPARVLPGLEESKGALYEIGVSDDGTLVGLAMDEMNESLNNLTAMAASLGCSVEVLRMITVGEGRWMEESAKMESSIRLPRSGELYMAEAYIRPILHQLPSDNEKVTGESSSATARSEKNKSQSDMHEDPVPSRAANQQIRVTLTGATGCGKSSLLGTLSTSTLDNGRGKSRLSLLKHRHEIASGMTSSVAQELIGYTTASGGSASNDAVRVINYATDNVTSWNDIHGTSNVCRLALLSDSAGHPRYRRTTVRGLIGWAPHWTMLCIGASEIKDHAFTTRLSDTTDDDSEPFAGTSAHLSMAHLDLCLRLHLPLIVVITKLDAASKSTFRQVLATLLSTLKGAGRKPLMVANDGDLTEDFDLQCISQRDYAEIKRVVGLMGSDAYSHVPVVFTSALKGNGIGKTHALLSHLPVMTNIEASRLAQVEMEMEDEARQPSIVFHVDEVYELSATGTPETSESLQDSVPGAVISGRLSRGRLSVGREVMLGPFNEYGGPAAPDNPSDLPSGNRSEEAFLTPRSFTDALAKAVTPQRRRLTTAGQEWRRVKIVSARNLRLPVHTLEADRVGTLGIQFIAGTAGAVIRRGMVLVDRLVSAAHTVTIAFDVKDAASMVVGSRVVIYCASIRTSAKIVAVALDGGHSIRDPAKSSAEYEDFAFSMESDLIEVHEESQSQSILVTLQLDAYREYLEKDTKVLLMPGGGPGLHSGERGMRGLAGLEGFAGSIVKTFS